VSLNSSADGSGTQKIMIEQKKIFIVKQFYTKFFFFLLFLSTAMYPQSISKIEISGNKYFSVNDYFGWIKISIGEKYFAGMEDSAAARIADALRERGYFNFSFNKIKLENLDSVKSLLEINLSEGRQTLINKINFSSPLKDSLQLFNILYQLKNSPFTRTNIEYVFSEILDYYENKGFPFASVKVESVEFTNDSTKENYFANLFLSIEEGTKSTIDKIEIAGNNKTKDFVITRAIQIQKGEEYSQKKIDAAAEKLNRLRFFEPTEPPVFYFNSKKEGVLKISIKEKETNYFDGIAGYIPAPNNKESGYLTGFVNVNLQNLFGTGRVAALRWQQENRYSQELELRYVEPWLFDFPFNIEGNLYQRKQDTTYVQRRFEGRLEFLATHEISASLLIGTQSTIPSEQNLKTITVFNSSAFTSGLNLKVDTRDDFYAPTRGIFFVNSYKYTSKKINGPGELITPNTKTKITLQRIEFDFSIFKQLFDKQVAAISVHGREVRGSEVEFSDLYFLGGANSLRGYRERQFQGNRIFWSNLEYRLLLTRRSFAFLFFDTGYFLQNADTRRNILQNSSFTTGYGFGLKIETGLGVLGVSFALGKGDSFGQGKIHFGIINEF
ncbi:MAG: BamA/TamA family outer membrane protein, partial [Bacteroidota bacterium]